MFVVPGAMHNPVTGGVAFSGSGGGAVSLLNALLPNPVLMRAAGAGNDSWQTGSVNGAPNLIPNMSVSAAETETVDAMVSKTTSELAAAVKGIGL